MGFEVGREITEEAIFPLAGGAIDDEHPRPGAVGKGLLGDEIVGEVVIEIGKKHLFKIIAHNAAWHDRRRPEGARHALCAILPTVNWKH